MKIRCVAMLAAATCLAAWPAAAQKQLNSAEIVDSLQGATEAPGISAALLRRQAQESLANPQRANRLNREPLSEQLNKLAQFTVTVQFDLNSARIRPESYRTVGLIADSLYHPYLLGYRFIVVGHTDGTGKRDHNLRLSQQRAEAIRAALINPFGINPSRVEAVGLGEEQLLNSANPESGVNRRVQLINVGK
jgi:outer membrane protein OmpA-like peptidoglycan-associated protein